MKIFVVTALFFLSSCGGGQLPKREFGAGLISYKVTFSTSWSRQSHPSGFPASPHFSKLIGATHNINTDFWLAGELASAGIESMAETGRTSILASEINDNINLGDSDIQILAAGIASSLGTTSFILNLNTTHTFLTLVTMLAPSPDWFVGVSAYNLMPNGNWLEKEIITLFAYDAGSDSGINYSSPNADTNPKEVIKKIETSPFKIDNTLVAVGRLTVERIK